MIYYFILDYLILKMNEMEDSISIVVVCLEIYAFITLVLYYKIIHIITKLTT